MFNNMRNARRSSARLIIGVLLGFALLSAGIGVIQSLLGSGPAPAPPGTGRP